MEMTGEVVLPADKNTVWTKLNDPVVLKACMPGVESFEKVSDTRFDIMARVRIGPLSATFRGRLGLSAVDPPNGCHLRGEGEGGLAGFAAGDADVLLTAVPQGTRLSYAVSAEVGGRLARIGGRVVDGVARKAADKFFARFAAEIRV